LYPDGGGTADLIDEPDFGPFVKLDAETDHLPIGNVRELWAPEALIKTDAEVRETEAAARDEVHAACRRLVGRFRRGTS
jgi:hypothetical protein